MTSYFIEVSGNVLMSGPTGILVSLGIENIPSLSLATIYMYYNYIAIALLLFVAAMSGARNESRFLVFVPVVGGIFTAFGWVHVTSAAGVLDPTGQLKWYTMLVICGILGVFSYMNDVNHEKYGIGGPGSKLLNIVVFIIVFQVAMTCISGFNLFESGTSVVAPYACTVGYSCDAYGNIDLTSSIGSANDIGGMNNPVITLLNELGLAAISILKFIGTLCMSVLFFSIILNSILVNTFPGVSGSIYYLAFLGLVQVGIWLIYVITLFVWYYKPMPGEGSL